MSDMQYTYAVARIRALEVGLFSSSVIEQLMSCKDEKQCLQFLKEKGWGDSDTPLDAEAILGREREKIWEVMKELEVDMSLFDVLSYENLFHNLKAAIKEVCTETTNPHIFYRDNAMPREVMIPIVKNKDWQALPENMRVCAQEAYETLLQTRDGQLCDVIVDRATLLAIYQAGKKSKEPIIQQYAESTVAVTDIRIAVRSQKTAKSMEFMDRSLVECDSINIQQLAKAALSGAEALAAYLSDTEYAGAAEALAVSPSAFERWCDNRIIETIRPQKYNPFSAGPLVAYVLARENEIKTVRIILSGKQNGLEDDSIRERVREMYV